MYMKKTITLLALVLIAMFGFAQSFVMINIDNQQKTEELFNNDNLTIHYYNDNFVLATAKVVDESMTVLDSKAFSGNDVYTLVYCPQKEQQNYLGDGEALLQTDNFVLVKGAAMPYKNDGAVAIFNRDAKLPVAHRDFPVVTEENAVIREMMNQVNMDSLQATVQHLVDYNSRFFNSTGAYAASDWVAAKMEALGLEVEQQDFTVSGSWVANGPSAPNVIGIQRGTLYPDVYVVCGSHFDSFTWECLYGGGAAPGADDNATGVASVLESARIMTQYEFEYSIIYCAYGAEELGLYGSDAYATRCAQQGMQILGYFNNDMNGYLNPGDPIHIDLIYPNSVAPIGDYYMNVANVYFPELPVRHVNFNEGDSDHTSFNNNGYMGIYPFEDYEHYSPNIHTTNDLIGPSVNSWEMSQQYCRMNIGCLAEIANPVNGPQVYCNPVTGFELIDEFDREMSHLVLVWLDPEDGSTGNVEHFDIYRDNEVIATVEYGDYVSIGEFGVYNFTDTITVGAHAFYYINAVYSDGCESASETLEGVGHPDGVSEIGDLDGEIVRYEVYDMMGRLIYTEKSVWKNVDEIRVNNLESGIYMIRLFVQNGNTINKKVFIK